MQESLSRKIKDLFEYRLFPELIVLGNFDVEKLQIFEERLETLQYAIYQLDAQLEANWKLSSDDLNPYWELIFTELNKLVPNKTIHPRYVSHILKYQKHELELRDEKLPTRLSMEYFYFYKSCDVKLLRRIIYDHIPTLRKETSLADWRWFDLITEINDDVEDVFEDMTTINANRFLISLETEGYKKTVRTFLSFIDYIMEQSKDRMASVLPHQLNHRIHEMTLTNIHLTKSLLLKNAEEYMDLKKAPILRNYLDLEAVQ